MANTNWALDPTHSEIQFKVKHMMISSVSGEFAQFDAALETEGDDFTNAQVKFNADVNSITTKNEQRDGHLKSEDFFDAEKFPALSFESTGFNRAGDGQYTLDGNLTIKGITRPVTLDVEHGGVIKDPYGNNRAGFEVMGKINRKDFGLTWHQLTETGGLIVSDEIRIFANMEFVRQ